MKCDNFQRRLAVFACVVFVFPVHADELLRVDWAPKDLVASYFSDSSFGFKGTPAVDFTVTNTTSKTLEFPLKDWFVITQANSPGKGRVMFSAQNAVPLNPTQSTNAKWNIEDGTIQVHPRQYVIRLNYRLTGDSEWRSYTTRLAMKHHKFDLFAIVLLATWAFGMLVWFGVISLRKRSNKQ